MENELNILDQVQKVSAPPFLLTRIQQRIRNKKESNFSPALSWVFSLSLTIIVVANGVVLANMIIESKKEKTLLQSMSLLPNNELYK